VPSDFLGVTAALGHVEASIGGNGTTARHELLSALRRGEFKARAELLGDHPDRWKAVPAGLRLSDLPPEIWEYAQIGREGPDTVTWPKDPPYPGKLVRKDDDHYAFGVHVPREAILNRWPERKQIAENEESIPPGVKARGGAPPKYDWESMMAYAAVHIHDHGWPERKSGQLLKILQDWFAKRNQYPSASDVRRRVKLLYDTYQDDEAPESSMKT
jgi:hypothetical protein